MTRTAAGLRVAGAARGLAEAVAVGYVGVVTGAISLNLAVGRRLRRLDPLAVVIDTSRETVFDVLSERCLRRQTRAIAEKIRVLERGENMVLAENRTTVGGRLGAVTVEAVPYTRPSRVDFRVTRGPVPHVVEQFELTTEGDRTVLEYTGELGTDLWALGSWWGNRVAPMGARGRAHVRRGPGRGRTPPGPDRTAKPRSLTRIPDAGPRLSAARSSKGLRAAGTRMHRSPRAIPGGLSSPSRAQGCADVGGQTAHGPTSPIRTVTCSRSPGTPTTSSRRSGPGSEWCGLPREPVRVGERRDVAAKQCPDT